MTLPPPGQPSRLDVEPVTLFAYGTLAFPEVLQVLLGRVPDLVPTTVAGWRVARLPGHVYPAMVAAEAVVRGCLITDLSGSEWRIIDAFEDDIYELRQLSLTDGRHVWAYVCENHPDVSVDDWDVNQFDQDHLVNYLKQCADWRKEYKVLFRR